MVSAAVALGLVLLGTEAENARKSPPPLPARPCPIAATKAEIERVIELPRHRAELRACTVGRGGDTGETAKGKLQILVDVRRNGRVKHVSIDAASVPVTACLRRAIGRWRFPRNCEDYTLEFPSKSTADQ
jgi:hypothetical protein